MSCEPATKSTLGTRRLSCLLLLVLAAVGCKQEEESNWNPTQVPPVIQSALAAELDGEFTVMAYRPTLAGVTCGLISQRGQGDRQFVWDGELTLEPEVKGTTVEDGLRLASFSQFAMGVCFEPRD